MVGIDTVAVFVKRNDNMVPTYVLFFFFDFQMNDIHEKGESNETGKIFHLRTVLKQKKAYPTRGYYPAKIHISEITSILRLKFYTISSSTTNLYIKMLLNADDID